MATAFPWPPLADGSIPVWTGRGFRVAGRELPLVGYAVGDSGWSDDLTRFHEDNAGADHFIDRASRRHAVGQVRRHVRGASPVILEVGCSSGFLLEDLRREMPHARLIGSDYVKGPLVALAARMPDVPIVQFDLTRCPLPTASVDAVVLLNVLEHIEDDRAAVEHLFRILKPGGVAVIEVPAGPHLYDVYDKVLLHFRRYSLSGLRGLTHDAGFEVAHASSLGAFFYPGFWWVKRRNKRYLDAPEEVQRAIVAGAIRKTGRNRLLEAVMWAEDCLRGRVPLPFGIRCLTTCVKPAAGGRRLPAAA